MARRKRLRIGKPSSMGLGLPYKITNPFKRGRARAKRFATWIHAVALQPVAGYVKYFTSTTDGLRVGDETTTGGTFRNTSGKGAFFPSTGYNRLEGRFEFEIKVDEYYDSIYSHFVSMGNSISHNSYGDEIGIYMSRYTDGKAYIALRLIGDISEGPSFKDIGLFVKDDNLINKWVKVIATWSASTMTMTLSIDGVEKSKDDLVIGDFPAVDKSRVTLMCSSFESIFSGGTWPQRGSMRNFVMYDAQTGGNKVAEFALDTYGQTTIPDTSGNGNDARLDGGFWDHDYSKKSTLVYDATRLAYFTSARFVAGTGRLILGVSPDEILSDFEFDIRVSMNQNSSADELRFIWFTAGTGFFRVTKPPASSLYEIWATQDPDVLDIVKTTIDIPPSTETTLRLYGDGESLHVSLDGGRPVVAPINADNLFAPTWTTVTIGDVTESWRGTIHDFRMVTATVRQELPLQEAWTEKRYDVSGNGNDAITAGTTSNSARDGIPAYNIIHGCSVIPDGPTSYYVPSTREKTVSIATVNADDKITCAAVAGTDVIISEGTAVATAGTGEITFTAGTITTLSIDGKLSYDFTAMTGKTTSTIPDLSGNANDGEVVVGAGGLESFWAKRTESPIGIIVDAEYNPLASPAGSILNAALDPDIQESDPDFGIYGAGATWFGDGTTTWDVRSSLNMSLAYDQNGTDNIWIEKDGTNYMRLVPYLKEKIFTVEEADQNLKNFGTGGTLAPKVDGKTVLDANGYPVYV